LATEGGGSLDYDPLLRPRLTAEAARVIRAFSFAGAHVVVVGGLVPSLLVPHPEPGLEPHVGTQDLDLCLSIALVEGDVGNYERLERCLKDAGFRMAREQGTSVSWRWLGGVDLPLTVEFFCPPGEDRAPGKLFRPGGVVGGKLSAMVLAAGRLIDSDTRNVEIDVQLPGGGGKTRQAIKVVGPGAYLAAKADALRRRTKNKDAYDTVWMAESWPGGQPALAEEIYRGGRLLGDAEFQQALEILRQEFATIDSAGAIKYARFMADDGTSPDALARRAVGAISRLLVELDGLRAPAKAAG
jgi:hypothetical protein